MQLRRAGSVSSASIFLTAVFLITRITAQDLPKLSAAASAAAATSGGSSDTATTDQPSGTTTGKPSGTASSLPSITSSVAGALTGLPKLAGDDYPPPTVPPTADAPFMQKSSLPEGTVFICVGAALGFLGMLVVGWRALVAWSIRRSVRRAANIQSSKYAALRDTRSGTSKGGYYAPAAESSLSLDKLGGPRKGNSKNPSARASLFFSPTAGSGLQTPSHRGSGYLPAGYYAAGNPAPSGMTHVGGGGALPMTNLTNQNKRHSSRAPSPSGASSLAPSRGADSPYKPRRLSTQGLVNQGASSSNLNLSAPPEGRAPSAYLEDLFENHPPGSIPPKERPRSGRF